MAKRRKKEEKNNIIRCKFWIPQKKRCCRLEPKDGEEFCPVHFPIDENETPDHLKRVPCPINPNHTVLKHKLKKHLTICPDGAIIRKIQEIIL